MLFDPNSLNFGSSYGSPYTGLGDFSNIAKDQASNYMSSPTGFGASNDSGGMLGGLSGWLFGSKDLKTGISSNGAAGSILGVAQGLGNAYMGMQQFGLAKKALAQSKEQFNKNYEAQRTTTNASLEDRQRARVASNAGAYESVGAYMNKNGIK